MVRLAVSTPDSPPLISGSTQVLVVQSNSNALPSAANNSYAHQTDAVAQPTTATPLAQASISPTQQNSHQMAQNIPPGVIPLNQMSPHHMPPFHHHSNGHHHNGLYLGPPYGNEFYPAGSDSAPHHGTYFMPPEMCPAHTQLCTVHPDYGEKEFSFLFSFFFRLFCFLFFFFFCRLLATNETHEKNRQSCAQMRNSLTTSRSGKFNKPFFAKRASGTTWLQLKSHSLAVCLFLIYCVFLSFVFFIFR